MSHLTIAVSERTVRRLFEVVIERFRFEDAKTRRFGRFAAGYNIAFHLENGSIDLHDADDDDDDGTVDIRELDIIWERLMFTLEFDIPEICVGGFCIIPNPFDDCLVSAPRFCLFSGNPDVSLSLNLRDLVRRSEISVRGSLKENYKIDPERTPEMTDLDAEDAEVPNKWQIFLDPRNLDVDPIDFADVVADLLEHAVREIVYGLLGPLPDWAKDLILAILGPIIDLIRYILDIPTTFRNGFPTCLVSAWDCSML